MRQNDWEASCHHTDTCGLTGSAAFFLGIPDAAILVNGPLWCYFYALRYLENAAGNLSDRMFCTQPMGQAVVYGTEADLLAGFELIQKIKIPGRLLVESNCSLSMIGDDLAGIAARAELPFPVYTLDSGGIHGGFAEGWSRAALRVVREMETGTRVPLSVNLWGATPFLLKGAEDVEEIRRLLALSGIHALSAPGAGSPWEEMMEAPCAALDIVLRDELGLAAAKEMENRFGIPYISCGLPYGLSGTERWISEILSAIGGGSAGAVKKESGLRGARLTRLGSDMESLWGPLWFDQIFIAGHPSEAAGLAEAVRGEWADTGRLVVHLTDAAEREIPAADEIFTCGRDEERIRGTYADWPGGLLMGSAHEASRLLRLHKPFLSCNIAYPSYNEMFLSDLPFCGLRGAGHLYERLWNAFLHGKMK